MGYRLQEPEIVHRGATGIISDGVPLGAVQVPADRQPIVMMADRQTTGGYTKIATVCSIAPSPVPGATDSGFQSL